MLRPRPRPKLWDQD